MRDSPVGGVVFKLVTLLDGTGLVFIVGQRVGWLAECEVALR